MRVWGKFQKDSNFPGDPGAPIVTLFKLGGYYCTIWRESKYDKYWQITWNEGKDVKEWRLEDYQPTEEDYQHIMHSIFESNNGFTLDWPLRKNEQRGPAQL
jgi:hypothetical protein